MAENQDVNKIDAAFNKAKNARKCAAIVMFGEWDTNRDIAFIFRDAKVGTSSKHYEP